LGYISICRSYLILIPVGLFLFSPVLNFFEFIAGILNSSSGLFGYEFDIFIIVVLLCGVLLMVLGGFFHKFLALMLLFFGITGSIDYLESFTEFTMTGISVNFPNYFLFIVSVLTGILLLVKIKGKLPKILGVVLPIATFPMVSRILIENYNYFFDFSFEIKEFTIGIGTILIMFLSIISAIYLLTKLRGESKTVKSVSMVLSLLLIVSSLPFVFVTLLEYIGIATQAITEFFDEYTSVGFSVRFIIVLIGLICFVGKEKARSFAGKTFSKQGFKKAKGWMKKKEIGRLQKMAKKEDKQRTEQKRKEKFQQDAQKLQKGIKQDQERIKVEKEHAQEEEERWKKQKQEEKARKKEQEQEQARQKELKSQVNKILKKEKKLRADYNKYNKLIIELNRYVKNGTISQEKYQAEGKKLYYKMNVIKDQLDWAYKQKKKLGI